MNIINHLSFPKKNTRRACAIKKVLIIIYLVNVNVNIIMLYCIDAALMQKVTVLINSLHKLCFQQSYKPYAERNKLV